MSGKVMVWIPKIMNVSARQFALSRWTATDKRWKRTTSFWRVICHLSQTPYSLCHELLSTGTPGTKSFQRHLEKVMAMAECTVFVCLSDSCSLSHTGPGDDTLLEAGTVQGAKKPPITHGILLTFSALGRHRLLIAPNATSPICLFTITEKVKWFGLRLKF